MPRRIRSNSIIIFDSVPGQPTMSVLPVALASFPPPLPTPSLEFAMIRRMPILVAGVYLLVVVEFATAATRPPVSYGRDIRPILSDKCYRCHGPDGAARQAELRLDTREGLTSKVVVPGKPDKSELVARIFGEDDDERMPPP